MRFISLVSVAIACVAAAPYAAPGYSGEVVPVPYPHYPVYPGGVVAHPSTGAGNGSNGNSSGSNGSGSNGSGSNGSGSNGSGSNGSVSNGSGSNGAGSKAEVCGLTPGQVAALTPLINELKLARTVDDLKRLVHQITDLLADTLQQSAVTSLLNLVDSLVAGLGLGGLNLKPAIDNIASILRNQIPCLLNTLLPSP
ncbi:hypothetical protein IWQ56_003365 [Coemansia nantahalensis]|uniref:Uncharacterized protein n=1 Tax=Coemansia nantahalensis TaxID=2789366 RepID=A0ACC1K6I2_9FUNG|nr:hypothetical protein IWQ56_003365 [Coemansia nantahalensis]KAJ2774244.1 hypothetical protein IWQ57_000912 [Coemansia nantahalensis]